MSFSLDDETVTKLVRIADDYRVHRDTEFSPMLSPAKRGNFMTLVRLTNQYASLVACELPYVTIGELEFLFRAARHNDVQFTDNPVLQNCLVELLGVLTARRSLAEKVDNEDS